MAATAAAGNAGNVVVTLIADRDTIPERSLFLDKAHSVIPIGRASKVSAKGFVATQTNAWFQSAVMSRKHAELTADLEQKKVYVRDIGSLHGTYMNPKQDSSKSIKLNANELYELQEGTELTLGVPIWRSSEEYTPTSLRVSITHRSQNPTETCNREPKQAAPISTFSVPDDDYSSDENMSESSLSSPLPKQVVSAMKRTIKKHATIIEYNDEVTGTDSNPVDLTYEKAADHELIDLTPEEQSNDNDNTSCVVPVDSSASEDEETHVSDSGSEATSGHSSFFDGFTRRCSHDSQMELEAASLDDTDEETTDAIKDDGEEEHAQQRDNDGPDHDNDHRETDSPAVMESERARQSTMDDHDMDGTDDGVSENDDSSESEGYLSDDDVLNPNDSDVAVFHKDGFGWPPHVSESFGPASFGAVRPGDQNSATTMPANSATAADYVQFGYYPLFTRNQTVARLPPPLWAGNRTCSRRSLHDVVATDKSVPAVHEVTYQVRHPGETAVATSIPVMQRGQAENTNLSTLRPTVLNPFCGLYSAPIAGMGTLTTKENELEAISSAHDLEVQKRSATCSMKIANILAGSPQPQDTVEDSGDRPQAPVKGGSAVALGKRKSDDISTTNEVEDAWESRMTNHFAEAAADLLSVQSAQPKALSPVPDESNMAVDLEDVPASKSTLAQTSTAAPTHTQPSDLPSAAPSSPPPGHSTLVGEGAQTQLRQLRCVVRRGANVRPAKRQRIRHIAERLGYAALGGVSVGAAIVTTLIYTAPTF